MQWFWRTKIETFLYPMIWIMSRRSVHFFSLKHFEHFRRDKRVVQLCYQYNCLNIDLPMSIVSTRICTMLHWLKFDTSTFRSSIHPSSCMIIIVHGLSHMLLGECFLPNKGNCCETATAVKFAMQPKMIFLCCLLCHFWYTHVIVSCDG